jgi:hypothetical protein
MRAKLTSFRQYENEFGQLLRENKRFIIRARFRI